MNSATNYENWLTFVRVMPKILVIPFFPDTVNMQCDVLQYNTKPGKDMA